ncbi:MAG: acyltransferase family protein [Microgenomates group bacterium]
MVFLGQVADGRDNNLNLIRFLAATAVLVSHAVPITLGETVAEPLEAVFGRSLGSVAVFIFFAISGFLISASFVRSSSGGAFWRARALRIIPCLVVSVVLVGFVLGPAVTTLPLTDYLTQPKIWTFLPRNILLALPQYTLPGVFETNPYPTVLGSIWTLVHEVGCYGMVFVLGLLGCLRTSNRMMLALGAYAAFWAVTVFFDIPLHIKIEQFRLLSFPFIVGMVFHMWRDRIPLSIWGGAGLIFGTVLLRDTALYTAVFVVTLAYVTLWAAFAPGGALRVYNRVGDYSYGLYLYAFPIQGLVVWLWGPMTPGWNILLALPITLILSVLSWHLIEAPALRLRKSVGRRAV